MEEDEKEYSIVQASEATNLFKCIQNEKKTSQVVFYPALIAPELT